MRSSLNTAPPIERVTVMLTSDTSPWPVAHLEDGSPVLLRLVTPADREIVLQAFQRLSEESKYHRFWNAHQKLPSSLLQRFLNPHQGLHETWAAQDLNHPNEPGYGGASYWRNEKQPERAEISLVIADEAQHRGVGTLLLAMLWIRARNAGIRIFYGHVLTENKKALNWFHSLGALSHFEFDHDVFELPLDLSELAYSDSGKKLLARIHELSAWGNGHAPRE